MYSKSYCCSKCDKMWKNARDLNRHEKTCEATVRHVFPGGAYKVPQTIFDLLADEGVEISDDLKYFPYRETYDFECYFKRKTGLLRNTAKLTWEAEHIPLTVSVCSNVPGYDHPKCFVSPGNMGDMIKRFVDYLVEIKKAIACCRIGSPKYLIKSTNGSQTVRYVILAVDLLDPIRCTY